MGAAIAAAPRRPPARSGSRPSSSPARPGSPRRRPATCAPTRWWASSSPACLPRRPAAASRRAATAADLARAAPDNLASLRGFFGRPAAFGRLLQAIAADGPGVAEDDIRRIAVPTLVIGHGRDLAHPLRPCRGAGRPHPRRPAARHHPQGRGPRRLRPRLPRRARRLPRHCCVIRSPVDRLGSNLSICDLRIHFTDLSVDKSMRAYLPLAGAIDAPARQARTDYEPTRYPAPTPARCAPATGSRARR